MKATDVVFDIDELEEAEYTENDFGDYEGEIPPKGTILTAYIKKMWWTDTKNQDDMIKVLVEADGNEGDLEEYNGLPLWDNLALIATAKFKWKPFIDHFGITLKDIKNKTILAAADEKMGAPIEKVGTFVPGSDDSWCRVLVARERNQDGELMAVVKKWLDYEAPEDQDPDDDEDEPDDEELEDEEEPEDDEDGDEDDEDEEVEPEPPARPGRRTAAAKTTAAKPAAARTAGRAAKTPAATPARSDAAKPRTARSATTKAATPATARRGTRRAAAVQDEPPF
jgi:hypothetical protein